MADSEKIRVYVCTDLHAAKLKLAGELEAAGFEVVTRPEPRPGENVREAVREALDGVDLAVIAALNSFDFDRIEVEELDELRRRRVLRILPVMADEMPSERLPAAFMDLQPLRLYPRERGNSARTEQLSASIQEVAKNSVRVLRNGRKTLYFVELGVSRFRCFGEDQRLSFGCGPVRHSRWNVLLGENGSGKTTTLRVLASYAPDMSREWLATPEVQGAEVGVVVTEGDVAWPLRAGQDGPTCYAYGAGRGTRTVSLASRDISPCATLFDESAALPDPEELMLRTDYAAARGIDDAKVRWQRLKDIFCEKILPEVSDLRVNVREARVEAQTKDGWVFLRDLSFGYKSALTWIMDVMERMFERYPDSSDPLAEPAVVLVDEIDLHLHPSWQRKLLEMLDQTFKRTQFIVTAHSPLIVQTAPNANLALLRRQGDRVVIENDLDYIREWRVDQILASELFGNQPTHSPRFEKLIAEKARIGAKGYLTESDRERLREMDAELERLPTAANPSDIEAMDIIREAAAALKGPAT